MIKKLTQAIPSFKLGPWTVLCVQVPRVMHKAVEQWGGLTYDLLLQAAQRMRVQYYKALRSAIDLSLPRWQKLGLQLEVDGVLRTTVSCC